MMNGYRSTICKIVAGMKISASPRTRSVWAAAHFQRPPLISESRTSSWPSNSPSRQLWGQSSVPS